MMEQGVAGIAKLVYSGFVVQQKQAQSVWEMSAMSIQETITNRKFQAFMARFERSHVKAKTKTIGEAILSIVWEMSAMSIQETITSRKFQAFMTRFEHAHVSQNQDKRGGSSAFTHQCGKAGMF